MFFMGLSSGGVKENAAGIGGANMIAKKVISRYKKNT